MRVSELSLNNMESAHSKRDAMDGRIEPENDASLSVDLPPCALEHNARAASPLCSFSPSHEWATRILQEFGHRSCSEPSDSSTETCTTVSSDSHSQWSRYENETLLLAIQGGNTNDRRRIAWKRIAQHAFNNERSPAQLRAHYNYLTQRRQRQKAHDEQRYFCVHCSTIKLRGHRCDLDEP